MSDEITVQGFATDAQRASFVEDQAKWLESFVDAGFTREEAMQMLCKPVNTIQNIVPAKQGGGRR